MGISLRAAGTLASGTTSASPAYPAGLQPTDISLLTVSCKPYNSTITTPSGWTKIVEITNGTTASGADTGSVLVATYYRVGAFTGTTTVTLSGSNSVGAQITSFQKSDTNKVWDLSSFTTGIDNTNGANYSATGLANINVTTGDWIYTGTGMNANLGSLSANLITATGATLGSTINDTTSGFNDGDNGRVAISHASVDSGSSSGAPAYTCTNASSSSGATIFVRMRLTTPTIVASFNGSVDSPGNDITVGSIITGDLYDVYRDDPSGLYPSVKVRGMDTVTPSTTTATDYEAPFVSGQQYRLQVYINVSTLYATVTINLPTQKYVLDSPPTYVEFYTKNSYIKDVVTPANSLAMAIGEFRTTTTKGRVLGEHYILGRPLPVIVTDETGGREGTMEVFGINIGLYGRKTTSDIELMLNSGHVLLFQNVSHPDDIKDMYFIVESYTRELLGQVTAGSELIFRYQIDLKEVDRPSTSQVTGVSTATWSSVLNDPAFSTWQNVKDQGSWLKLLQRYL